MKPEAHEFFEILAREHAPMVYAFLRASGHSSAAADDLLQETLLVAWSKIGTFDRTRPFAPWLRGIAANVSLARWRKLGRSKERALSSEVIEHIQHRFEQLDAAHGSEFTQKIAILQDCLERLQQTERVIVQKKYHDGWSLAEIATSISLNLETVKKRIQRARAKLKRCIISKLDRISGPSASGKTIA